jgi:hypothetical protein
MAIGFSDLNVYLDAIHYKVQGNSRIVTKAGLYLYRYRRQRIQ